MSKNKTSIERILESRLSSWAGTAIVTPLIVLLILFGSLPNLHAIVFEEGKRIIDIFEPPPESESELSEESLTEDTELEELTQIDDDFELPEDDSDVSPFEANEPEAPTRTEPIDRRVRSVDIEPERITTKPEEFEDAPPGTQSPASKEWARPGTPLTPDGSVNTDEIRRGPGGEGPDDGDAPGISSRDGSGVGPIGEVQLPGRNGPGGRIGVDLGAGANLTGEKRLMVNWILENPGPLPSVMNNKLSFDPAKDVSALQVAKTEDASYHLFLVYRRESNLLRILVVRGNDVFLFSLPGFEIKARHIQVGTAEWVSGRVVGVSLKSLNTIPPEASGILDVVLQWLDIVKAGE